MTTTSHADVEMTLRAEMVHCGRLLYERGLIVAGDGNLSARLPDGSILMTPAGLAKGMLQVDDLVVVDLDGHLLRGAPGRQPSSERYLHLFVYRQRSDIMACVHAHPPTAVGATLAGVSLAEPLLPEALIALGPIPTAPYALTGTPEMGEAIAPFVADHEAILLAYHGALTYGVTLMQAFHRMEQIEHCARALLAAHLFGGARPLPSERLAELAEVRRAFRAAGRI
ncbi:class II aldolase/adducin family protein [Chloroflexus sp.]|uniref:class II aldolase/adducin family protein n=1 Tax=Chloroflexus sp. TaxID=1904827 RepID=UPI0026356B8F|nr:class II aldolase/adducin family protein [uncultured Chloroflexus sp.]